MLHWFKQLDQILRGDVTRPDLLRKADLKIPLRGITVVLGILGVVYGICMGSYALFRGFENQAIQDGVMQMVANMIKVPALFILTLIVTFPSLYVFNALVGSRLKLMPLLRLLMAALAVNLAILASLGPIVAFFSVSTPDYAFVVLMNVAVFSASGFLGLGFLIQTLNRMSLIQPSTEYDQSADVVESEQVGAGEVISASDMPHASHLEPGTHPAHPPQFDQTVPPYQQQPGPIDRITGQILGAHVKTVFSIWVVIFGIVGAQMGWVLRPFIGSPGQPFSWFRERDSNFFEAVFRTLINVVT